MSEGEPNGETFFAREGTSAHTFVEYIMREKIDPNDWLDGVVMYDAPSLAAHFYMPDDPLGPEVDEWHAFEINGEMVEGAELYREVIERFYTKGVDVIEFETKLDISHVHPLLFGTSDTTIYKPKQRHLIVIDYKYGRGYAVEVKNNPQAKTYAVGSARKYARKGIDKITLVIVQPRAFHVDGPVREYELTYDDLKVFEQELRDGAAATDDPDAPLVAGSHCKWCPAAWKCPALRTYVREAIGSYASDESEPVEADLPVVGRLNPDQLGRIMREQSLIENWLRRVASRAHAEAFEGRVPTGMKLVDKRAYRQWTNPEQAKIVLEKNGVDEGEYMEEPKFKTVAKIEKVLGKKRFEKVLKALVVKRSTGYVLAPTEDRRDSVDLKAKHAFAAVEDDDE